MHTKDIIIQLDLPQDVESSPALHTYRHTVIASRLDEAICLKYELHLREMRLLRKLPVYFFCVFSQ
jgi:hypothetical protein